MSRGLTEVLEGWDSVRSSELYGVEAWGNGFFHILPDGYAAVKLQNSSGPVSVKFHDIVQGLYQRGFSLPILLRFGDLLAARLQAIHGAFGKAIAESNYTGLYRGVYPIKVNQQQQTVADVVKFGRDLHHGLEAGSKAELIAALAYLHDPEAYIICNGYKDAEFIDLALSSLKMGLQTILVLEMPGELDLLLERAAKMNVRPRIGIRVKLASSVGGKWAESGGQSSVFGMMPPQVIAVIDRLREAGMLDCLELLHYHLGSQVPNIREIRDAIHEAARYYASLVQEGAKMGILDIGGGLAIDYDGSRCNCASSANYDVAEYAADVVEGVMAVCDQFGVAHPVIVSESGRALVGYYSVLLINVLSTSSVEVVGAAPADGQADAEADPQPDGSGRQPAHAQHRRILQRRHFLPRRNPEGLQARRHHPAPARAGRPPVLAHPHAHPRGVAEAAVRARGHARPRGSHGRRLLLQLQRLPVAARQLGHRPALPGHAHPAAEREARAPRRALRHHLRLRRQDRPFRRP